MIDFAHLFFCRRVSPFRWLVPRVAALLLAPSVCVGQDVTEPALKAALVFNFAKFTAWPDDALASNATFVACVLGDATVSDALDRTAKNRLLAGHHVSVTQITANGMLRSCHLLYVSNATTEQVTRTLTTLRGVPVLTIVDIERLTPGAGIARVFVENGKLRFDFDYGLAKRSRLQLSSKLLSLASHVYDEPSSVKR